MDPKSSRYETIWSAEDGDHPGSSDHDEFLSETDVDTATEKQWHADLRDDDDEHVGSGRRRWQRASDNKGFLYTLDKYRAVIDTSLLLVIIALMLLLLFREPSSSASTRQIGSDYKDADNHQFSSDIVKWNADFSFVPDNTTEFFSNATLDRWNTLLPSGISNPGGPVNESFSATSMTHQLHCLFMMGRIYSALEGNFTEVLMFDYQTHFLHCIDYIRQAVMCAGDVALEPHAPNDGKDLGPLDGGWNGIHVCKNYGEVLKYLDDQIDQGNRVVLPIDD